LGQHSLLKAIRLRDRNLQAHSVGGAVATLQTTTGVVVSVRAAERLILLFADLEGFCWRGCRIVCSGLRARAGAV
jgi:hypothetical protein